MPEDILPACDLCYSRKVKCNRERNCANCVDAGVACQRLRPGRASKPKFSPRLPEESVFRVERATSNIQSESHILDSIPEQEENAAAKRRKLDSHANTETPTACNPAATPDNSTHHAQQAKLVIQIEVDGRQLGRRHLSNERRRIFESAVKLVDRMSRGEHLDLQEPIAPESARELLDIEVPQTPAAELLYMLLPEPSMGDGLHHHIRWPDHISDKAFERMMTSLLDGDCKGQLFHHYSICVYVKAMFHLYQLARRSTNPAVKKQLQKSKRTYEAAALQALKHINLISTPSLSLIQALISAALLMQHTTNISQCWLLNSYAARQIISLNYHKPCSPPSQSGCNDEIQSAVFWCFYLDRTTSALLIRHPSLPELNAPPIGFLTTNISSPYNKLLLVLLDLAKVQGTLLDITLNDSDKSRSRIFEIFQGVQERMDRVYSSLQETRSAISGPALYDWVAADFSYYAIYVDMLRTRLGYDGSPATHSDCLVYSRRALRAFHYLQEHVDHMPGFNDPEPSFLTWTIALYPAAPFFVVFCNIIATSDETDYRLVQQIIKGLSQFKATPYLARLLSLLTSLLRLCDPLFHSMDYQNRQSHMTGEGPSSTQAPPNHMPTNTSVPAVETELTQGLGPQLSSTAYTTYMSADVSEQGVGDVCYPMADDLMWQLVNSQFPYSWLEADAILDIF